MKWSSSAPSNIALIKYMGKKDATSGGKNHASNASLSYSLHHLKSFVELESGVEGLIKDEWAPLELKESSFNSISLSEQGKNRFLNHLQKIKDHFNYSGNFVLRSNNDFPSDCGLASSASSFAALSLCAYKALSELVSTKKEISTEDIDIISELSRQGSGSSCRSFYSPWALWDEEGVRKVELPYQDLFHLSVIVDAEKKEVSSSAAHKKVMSSYLFKDRDERVNLRLKDLLNALGNKDWQSAFEITWAEFWDMHSLFETSQPSFGYMTSGSMKVLEYVRSEWRSYSDGPLCTMDAGPNIHLLFRSEQKDMAKEWSDFLTKKHFGRIFSNF